ncbi:MAG TPA: DUF4142 domain-containing protein [Verrucomicrobiae bacterium]|jgi:hypothetical protein
MKPKWSAVFIGAFLAAAAVTLGQNGAWTSSGDRQFINDFGSTSLEIQKISQMAQAQGADPQVKTLGQWLTKDYYQAAAQVAVNGQALGLGEAARMNSNAVREVRKLADLSGPVFDLAAVRALLKCERMATNQLTFEAENGGNLALRQSATILQLELTPAVVRTAQLDAQLNSQQSALLGSP